MTRGYSGIGPHAAGPALTAYTLPRAVLLILGGVLGDRHGHAAFGSDCREMSG
ncbi:hypothetical protein [Kribbella sp. NPDC006257]|uniref:hypothetical protein n=1 Tax=Kribbella sp. NPDC006257 TaxID=3156738 RepID=UPI0033A7B3CC